MLNILSKNITRTSIAPHLKAMVERGASDIFISVGLPIKIKVLGEFVDLNETKLTNTDIQNILEEILSDDQMAEFESTLEMNVALSDDDGERFRMNMFFHQGNLGVVIRHIKATVPSIDELGLPPVFKTFILEKRGLFLMLGATGSGKSTSVASMLEHRNLHGKGHIVTIEDPIEFVFKNKNCVFSQREIGVDTYSYGIALKNALRQAPDVLFIGELRDRESIENALMFSETGHLVVATIHANNTDHCFERILSMFPQDLHTKILSSLTHTLKALAGQRLIKGTDGKIKLAYEVLINEGLITELIRERRFNEIKEVMGKNVDNNMMTFDESLFRLVKSGDISKEVAIKEADNQHNLRLKLSQYSSSNISATAAASINTSVLYTKEDF